MAAIRLLLRLHEGDYEQNFMEVFFGIPKEDLGTKLV